MNHNPTNQKNKQQPTKCGFVACVGRPNAGKSSLLNWLVGEKITMVSHKANATRKRSNTIVMHEDNQIIFVDTPGLHEKEKLINQFMLEEALKAMGDCDLIIFLAHVTDKIIHYEKFLDKLNNGEIEVAIVGMENTGKSTFANALIKLKEAFPTGSTRCTFTSTKLQYGAENKAVVRFFTKDDFNSNLKIK